MNRVPVFPKGSRFVIEFRNDAIYTGHPHPDLGPDSKSFLFFLSQWYPPLSTL
jgi:hypothetical protein